MYNMGLQWIIKLLRENCWIWDLLTETTLFLADSTPSSSKDDAADHSGATHQQYVTTLFPSLEAVHNVEHIIFTNGLTFKPKQSKYLFGIN